MRLLTRLPRRMQCAMAAATALPAAWARACAAFGGSHAALDAKWWGRLVAAYGEDRRAYHNLEHLEGACRGGGVACGNWQPQHAAPRRADLLRVKEAVVPDTVSAEGPFLAALLFHDAVYDTSAKDNEEASAALLLDWLAERAEEAGAEPATVALAGTWAVKAILRTKHHTMGVREAPLSVAHPVAGAVDDGLAALSPTEALDLALLLDCDMAVLGRPWAGYAAYARGIRAEYSRFDDAAYRSGRAGVLTSFLEGLAPVPEAAPAAAATSPALVQGCIFSTDVFVARFEAVARANVAAEVALLRDAAADAREVMGGSDTGADATTAQK